MEHAILLPVKTSIVCFIVQLLETSILDARRVFRLFREIEPLQALVRLVKSKSDEVLLKWYANLEHIHESTPRDLSHPQVSVP